MDNAQQTAAKQDLPELGQALRQQLVGMEQRLIKTIRDMEANLLRAFYGYAETTQKHLTDLDRSDSGLRERLATVENRLLEVEKRLKMPPAA